MLEITLALAMAAAEPAAGQSLQAQFDAASKAATSGDCAQAVTLFDRLAPMPAVQKNPNVAAIVKLRRGICQVTLGMDASEDLRAGLGALGTDPEFRVDAAQAHLALGRIAYLNYDYASAKPHFQAAHDRFEPAERLEALVWLTRVTMFDPGGEALGHAERALALAAAEPTASKKLLGDLRTFHARTLFNHGQTAKAYDELKQALKEQGGLGLKVDRGDVITRSDLALAALLAGRPDDAREYLAFTGAGRMNMPFATAASMPLPPCGGPDKLEPQDVAVVEFGINDDGSVSYATPIYASRLGPSALAFARAVADWSWRPEYAVKVPPFFRAMTRVELRCSTEVERPSVERLLADALQVWLAGKGVQPFAMDGLTEARMVTPAKAELERRRAAGGGIALLPVLVALGENPVLPLPDRANHFAEADKIAATAGAPASARAYLAINAFRVAEDWSRPGRFRQQLRGLLAQPEMAGDARAAGVLKIMISEPGFRSATPADAGSLLQQVATDTRIDASDPLRVAALVRVAALQAQAGDLASARASYEATGLTEQQCSLVDAKPAMRRSGASSNDFPMAAMRWGFEGWVKTEYDIDAEGRTSAQRAVIAYPPFVFKDAAIGIAKDMRFQQSYRPAGSLGCGGAQTSIGFALPD